MSERIAVLGAGAMGAALAAEWLAAGHEVAITVSAATSPAQARARVAAHGAATDALVVAAGSADAAAGAVLVLESLPEDLAVKRRELRLAEEAAPAALLATNTSSLSVTAVAEGLRDPARLVGIHYLNPPQAFRVVEVVPGPAGPGAATDRALALLAAVGKRGVLLQRDVPGFLINRLQQALLRECVHLVDAGVATPEDIDLVIEEGLGRRWAALGPFATASVGGAELFATIAEQIWPALSAQRTPTGGVARRDLDAAAVAALRERRRQALEQLGAVLDR